MDYESKSTLVQLFHFVLFCQTNWRVDILMLEDVLLQLFLYNREDFRGWRFLILDLYNRNVL